MSWVLLAFLVVGLQTHEPTLGDALALQRQAEALACSIQDDACLVEEFRLRGAADQAVRRSDPAALGCTASDLACLAAAWLRIDKPNQSRLTAVMEARGWPPLAGEAAVGAWSVLQHLPSADNETLALRERAAPLILAEVRAGRLQPDHYARLADRNAMARGASQPFGTLRPCRDGAFDQSSIDDVAAVDARRRDIGMDILLSESLRLYDHLCRQESASVRPKP